MFAKRSALALTLAIVGTSFSLPGQVLAQPVPPAASQGGQPVKKPATFEEFNTYVTMAAINMCGLSQQKVPFKSAMEANLSMLNSVLVSKHGSRVAGAPEPLTQEQMINANVGETVVRVDRFCGKNIPADWKKEIDPIVARVRQAMEAAGKKPK